MERPAFWAIGSRVFEIGRLFALIGIRVRRRPSQTVFILFIGHFLVPINEGDQLKRRVSLMSRASARWLKAYSIGLSV